MRRAVIALLALTATGCGGNAFGTASLGDDAGTDAETDSGAPDTGSPPADSGAMGDGAMATDSGDSGHEDAAPPPPCTCPGDAGAPVSCFYDQNEPMPGDGAPFPVNTISPSPAHPSVTVTVTITTPPTPDHNAAWIDIDVSAFAQGATLHVSGQLGPVGVDGSAFLLGQCSTLPPSGSNWSPVAPGANVGNIAAGSPWAFTPYTFPAGTSVLHLGTEGSWFNASICPACMPGATNTNTVTVTVQ